MKPSPKKFRLQNTKIHLTYPDHVDIILFLDFFMKKYLSIELYSVVHEIGSTGHKHTHALFKFDKIFTSSKSNCFDYMNLHPNIKPVTSKTHWERTVEYHKKDGKPITNIGVEKKTDARLDIEDIWSHPSVSDAILNTCNSVKEVGGIIAAFNCKPINYGEEPTVNWKPWQQELYDELETTPDDRTVRWYWDPTGCAGKSFFAKHMGMYKGAFTTSKANAYHVATQIQDTMKKGQTILTVIFNFTRQCEAHKVYQAIEALKDGMITAEKYHGETMYFPSPHVVIFANYFPDIKTMTIDRWSIRVLDTDGDNVRHELSGYDIEDWIEEKMTKRGVDREEAMESMLEAIIDSLRPTKRIQSRRN